MVSETITQQERERLYHEVWAEPVSTVAVKYSISDTALRKKCQKYWIPLPPVGHWAKLRSGQKVYVPKLPEVQGDLRKLVTNYVLQLRPNLMEFSDDELRSSPDLFALNDETNAYVLKVCDNLKAIVSTKSFHKLIVDHRVEMTYRQKRDAALRSAKRHVEYYQLTKSQYRENKQVLPINVSDANIERSYKILDPIIRCIEGLEGEFVLRDDMDVYIYILRDAVMLYVSEEGNGKMPVLTIKLKEYNWYNSFPLNEVTFSDSISEPLENRVGEIVYKIVAIACKRMVSNILGERARQNEIDNRNKQLLLEQRRKKELEEIIKIEQISEQWRRAEKLRQFAEGISRRLEKGEYSDNRNGVELLIQRIYEKAD